MKQHVFTKLSSFSLAIRGSEQLRVACRWLATLLVAWGLLETKTGHRGRAKARGIPKTTGRSMGKFGNPRENGNKPLYFLRNMGGPSNFLRKIVVSWTWDLKSHSPMVFGMCHLDIIVFRWYGFPVLETQFPSRIWGPDQIHGDFHGTVRIVRSK